LQNFTPLPALLGGAMIGLSASLFLLTHGRVAGISGIFAGTFLPGGGVRGPRVGFFVGLLIAGVLLRLLWPSTLTTSPAGFGALAVAGVLVGFGTRLANGCTSGHGVCGLSRLSKRSMVATITFMLAGIITVYVVRHVLGGHS
jgi:uncharacterized membrane protein YedE/YeeE